MNAPAQPVAASGAPAWAGFAFTGIVLVGIPLAALAARLAGRLRCALRLAWYWLVRDRVAPLLDGPEMPSPQMPVGEPWPPALSDEDVAVIVAAAADGPEAYRQALARAAHSHLYDGLRPVYSHLYDGPVDYWPVDLPCPGDRESVLDYLLETGQATCPGCGDVLDAHEPELPDPEPFWSWSADDQ